MSSAYSIKTLWFWRKGEDGPELLVAWDEYTVDHNFDGWQAACKRELDIVRDDMSDLGYRYFDLLVDFSAIETAFYPEEVSADVLPAPFSVSDEGTT